MSEFLKNEKFRKINTLLYVALTNKRYVTFDDILIYKNGDNMVLQHNLSAIQVSRQLKVNEIHQADTSEKLSSGYRINKAADDASGLTISEKMRNQIRGLNQASRNIQDGISLLQVADGAMSEITSILQRVSELCVKGASDTNKEEDRGAIQSEVDQLMKEIDSITEKTEFNGIKLLQGENYGVEEQVMGGAPQVVLNASGTTKPMQSLSETYVVKSGNGGISEGNHSAGFLDFSGVNAGNISSLLGKGFHSTCCTCSNKYSLEFVNTGDAFKTVGSNYIYQIDIKGVNNGNQLIDRIIAAMSDNTGTYTDEHGNLITSANPRGHFTQIAAELDSMGNKTGRLVTFDERAGVSPGGENGIFRAGVYLGNKTVSYGDINIQAGANSGIKIKIELPNTFTDRLGIRNNVNVNSNKSANISLTVVQDAINKVSSKRSSLGAIQNRLDHSLLNTDNTSENTLAAESRIRDADMAAEMIQYAKHNIIEQAGHAMMAQANKNLESVSYVI